MKCLLHCVFRQAEEELPDGCGGEVFVVRVQGLAAAASPAGEGDATPALSRLVAYQQVIEAFHASRAVIPMRYGCLLEGEPAILRLLEEHRQEYETLLTQLEGMVEMGIRILWNRGQRPVPREEEAVPSTPGAAYLARLRKRHPPGDGLEAEEGRLAERIAGCLGGCHERLRAEAANAAGGRLLSLYFLTPRTSVADFRDRARRMQLPKGTRLLLSGPWPPYNFVSSPTPAGR
ncbi:MAG: GvpL/GvpF family gas vesicle protein [Acidobacteria bacterium]|nr:GvpL/GvpF family gas vesicle protein [Acidobacteriota bacterium]